MLHVVCVTYLQLIMIFDNIVSLVSLWSYFRVIPISWNAWVEHLFSALNHAT